MSSRPRVLASGKLSLAEGVLGRPGKGSSIVLGLEDILRHSETSDFLSIIEGSMQNVGAVGYIHTRLLPVPTALLCGKGLWEAST